MVVTTESAKKDDTEDENYDDAGNGDVGDNNVCKDDTGDDDTGDNNTGDEIRGSATKATGGIDATCQMMSKTVRAIMIVTQKMVIAHIPKH